MNKKQIKKVIEKFIESNIDIKFAYLFGSFVEEENFNDIDLALYPQQEIDNIKIALELEKQTKISFDVIDISKAPDHLIHTISKGEVIVDYDEDFRIDFITKSWSKYFDFKYYRDRYLEELNYE